MVTPPTTDCGEPAPTAETDSQVTAVACALEGTSAVVVLRNNSGGDLTPVSITIAPENQKLYFESISLAGETIYRPSDGLKSGTVTIPLTSAAALKPGEASLNVGDFFTVHKRKGTILEAPSDVVVTVQFDDGSVTTITVQ